MITNLLKILLLLSLLSACGESTQNKHSKRGSRAQLVAALPVETLALSTQQHVSGSLTAIHAIKIFNQEAGQIEKLPYFPGDNVKKDQTIVYIKNDKIEAFLEKSTATRIQTKSDLDRLSKLIKTNLTSQDEISQARTAYALAKAEESIVKLRLNDTYIKAPFAGVISERLREPGDIVPLHSHILSLIDQSKLKVKIQISELLLADLKLNSKVTIQIDALVNVSEITGRISRIYPTVDVITRKGTLEVELDNVPEGAKPGQLCRLIIHTPKVERLLIAAKAIQFDNSGEYVFRINGEKTVNKIRVQTGIQIENKIEIITGLKEQDLIVVEGFSNLDNGKKVKLANEKNNSSQTKNN